LQLKETVKTIENMLRSMREQKIKKLIDSYTAYYPRLKERPEQYLLLEEMVELYVHVKYELYPLVQELFHKDIKEYRRLMSLLIKVLQQIDRVMSKLGFTFTSQPYLPVEERKTYDPKAILRIKEQIEAFAKEIENGARRSRENGKEEKKKEKAKAVAREKK